MLTPGVESSQSVKSLLEEYATQNGYSSLGEIHHNFMSQFIASIAHYLYKWDEDFGMGNLEWQYYQDMAWGGLITDKYGAVWDEFIAHNPDIQSQDRILDIVIAEKNNTKNSSGDGKDCQ